MSKTDELFWKKLADTVEPDKLTDVTVKVINASVSFYDSKEEADWESAMKFLAKIHVVRESVKDSVKKSLEREIARYEKGNWDEADALGDLFAKGYTLDDFSYDPVRYEWAENIAEEHGLI